MAAFLVALAVAGISGPSGSAHAQEDDAAQSVSGRVQNRYEDEDGERVTEPVPDVRIVVEDEAGKVVGESVTDADGMYLIPMSEPGIFIVRIDTETLPEGLTVEDGKDSRPPSQRQPERDPRLLPR